MLFLGLKTHKEYQMSRTLPEISAYGDKMHSNYPCFWSLLLGELIFWGVMMWNI